METRETILWPHSDVCRKSSDRSFIVSLQQLYRLKIAAGCRTVVLLDPQRLERTDGLGPASQHKVPDQPPPKLRHPCRERRADANAGSEVFVGGFQPRRGIDGVAMRRLFKEPLTTEISNYRRTGVHADARDAERNPFFKPAAPEGLGVLVESQCA